MEEWDYKPAGDFGLSAGRRLRSLRRESGLLSSGVQLAWWTLARTYLGTFHRLSIQGRQNLPAEPPFVLIANHCSHLDTLTLAAALPLRLRRYVFPIAAGDTFFETPTRTALAALMLNALPMWRNNCGRHALKELRNRLTDYACIYVLFPEGTRSRDGRMASFKPGIGMILAESHVPVVPCRLSGTYEALPPKSHFPRARRVRLNIGPPLSFADVANRRAGWEDIAGRLQSEVESLGPDSHR